MGKSDICQLFAVNSPIGELRITLHTALCLASDNLSVEKYVLCWQECLFYSVEYPQKTRSKEAPATIQGGMPGYPEHEAVNEGTFPCGKAHLFPVFVSCTFKYK